MWTAAAPAWANRSLRGRNRWRQNQWRGSEWLFPLWYHPPAQPSPPGLATGADTGQEQHLGPAPPSKCWALTQVGRLGAHSLAGMHGKGPGHSSQALSKLNQERSECSSALRQKLKGGVSMAGHRFSLSLCWPMPPPRTDNPNCDIFHLLFCPSSDVTPLQCIPVGTVSRPGELKGPLSPSCSTSLAITPVWILWLSPKLWKNREMKKIHRVNFFSVCNHFVLDLFSLSTHNSWLRRWSWVSSPHPTNYPVFHLSLSFCLWIKPKKN